jgi:putative transposase
MLPGMWRPSKLTTEQQEERRLEAGRLLLAGELSQAEIARRLGVSARSVSGWARRLRESDNSPRALRNRPRSGRPSRLNDAQWAEVLELLGQGAIRAGFPTERWTLDRVRSLIRKRFGVTYHAHYLSAKLRASGWSAQAPAVRAKERDEELVRAWLAKDWPRIKKSLGVAGRRSPSSTRRGCPSGTK